MLENNGMKILFLEPFYGGSHKDFALGFQSVCPHEVTLVTLPDRFWKWRMRGAALYFARTVSDMASYDLILATDMMDLTDLKALAGPDLPPVWLYFHENQLDYPLAKRQKRDFHLGFTNIISALAADRVFFNSHHHLNTFLYHARKLIRRMPDAIPAGMIERIEKKTQVIYPGCRFEPGKIELAPPNTEAPLIIWNHRWEYDKNPDPFFRALARLKKKKICFSLALLGEDFTQAPGAFDRAGKQFKEELIQYGYLAARDDYLACLRKGAIVVSSAIQENFGISIVEAVRHGCIPLLPRRLSYPEIIPENVHDKLLYQTDEDLEERLEEMVDNYCEYEPLRPFLSGHMERYAWQNIIKTYPAVIHS